jgi:hypothetical protein
MAASEDGFREAIVEFESKLPSTERAQFANTTLEDVRAVINNIQTEMGGMQAALNFIRLQPFLEAMEQYATTMTAFCKTSSLPILCYIWGPMKFILQVRRA